MRVLFVGDSPLIQTGFGRVNAIAAKRFQEAGWSVASVAGLTKEQPKDDEGIKIYLPSEQGDNLGIRTVPHAVEDFKPDVLYMTADPGSATSLAYGTPDMPAFIYMPIEGAPLTNRDWRLVIGSIPLATTSAYGAEVIKQTVRRDVPWIYHGVDHNTFFVSGNRDEIRAKMGWEGKFVIGVVSTNVRRKQLPRLMQAVAQLKHRYKQKDIVLYMHTVPFQQYWLEGWNLLECVSMFGIYEETQFHPFMAKRLASIPERTGETGNPGLAELYEAMDLFVLPSQVEGFGLPIAEAMASGTPVLVTKYAAGWEVASPAGRGIPVGDWELHKSGTMYANVSVDGLAKEILRLRRNPKELKRMSEAGLKRAQDFQWSDFQERLIPLVEEAINAHQVGSSETEEEDKGNVEGQAQDPLGALTGEEDIQAISNLAPGQGEVGTGEVPQDEAG